jgi:hypothetical protein
LSQYEYQNVLHMHQRHIAFAMCLHFRTAAVLTMMFRFEKHHLMYFSLLQNKAFSFQQSVSVCRFQHT